jgi:hypothetical protein
MCVTTGVARPGSKRRRTATPTSSWRSWLPGSRGVRRRGGGTGTRSGRSWFNVPHGRSTGFVPTALPRERTLAVSGVPRTGPAMSGRAARERRR